ncbi:MULTISPECIES: MerR family transcriptional regulator [Thalassospira]|uniref:MerR family transcriptional regulator n=1 Tax=Thalassospira TaxID=168934 RepID=UPI0008DD102B|nr:MULTISPECIES: MerR family transcriptional regulator [Thalassospira]MAB34433.1 MerR family transcriptional regulator [Thalassospira sp.]MDM7975975.1 MerR family transcriptional regulator [Thalassospira xiamenensis]OHZ04359.1 MerR family transcriptional regulator [Thalassospira sp. MIT1004]HBS25084.1 MerR family transcriptional regulator [Thalassospira sp.]|tara:strand:- start:199 stop:564 length:366 start_codon:yes stop_codon:yes gene_type:complete
MMIGEVSAKSGLPIHTLRYYEKIGLVPKPSRDAGGRRYYDPEILDWLTFISRLKDLGMPIRDRVRFARLRSEGEQTVVERRELLEIYRTGLAQKIAELTETLEVLDYKIANYDEIGRKKTA